MRLPPSEHMGPLGKQPEIHLGGRKAVGTAESPGATMATFTRESSGVRAPLNAKDAREVRGAGPIYLASEATLNRLNTAGALREFWQTSSEGRQKDGDTSLRLHSARRNSLRGMNLSQNFRPASSLKGRQLPERCGLPTANSARRKSEIGQKRPARRNPLKGGTKLGFPSG